MDSNQDLVPASVTADDLAEQLAARRQEAGIVVAEFPDPFERFRQGPPALTAEQVAAREAALAREAERERRAAEAERVNELFRQAGERYRDCSFESWKFHAEAKHAAYQRRVIGEVRGYAAAVAARTNGRQGLVLYGPVGTGKDHLAVCVAVNAVRAGLSVRYVNGQDWFGSIRDAMDDDSGLSEAQIIGRVATYDLAVISDPLPPIGNLSPHQATMLYRAVQNRYAAGRATIVTLNVASDDEADSRLGVPTWDRIRDGALTVLCQWPSYRRPSREIRP